MNQLVMGFPLYRQVPASFFSRWLGLQKPPGFSTVTCEGAYLPTSMKTIVDRALDLDDWDRLVILEQDMIPPLDALIRIAHYQSEHAIVGSMYFRHEQPHTAICYVGQPDGGFLPITPQTVKDWCDDPGLYQCGAVGFGLTSIARHVLEDWDHTIPMFGVDDRVGSHDIWFCEKAAQQGHPVYVDSGLICEHVSEVKVGLQHNQDCAPMIETAKIIDFDYGAA